MRVLVNGQSGTRHEGACQLVNKGDDELVFKVPVDEAALLNAGDVVHYRAVLHAGVPGTAGHVIEWTSRFIVGAYSLRIRRSGP